MKRQESNPLTATNAALEKRLRERSELNENLSRQLKIEASLERVRAKAMAMQKSDDLAGAVAIIFEELDNLNIGMLRCGVGIINKLNKSINVWASTKSPENMPVHFSGDESMESHPLLQGAYEAWLRQEDYGYELKGDDLVDYYKTQVSSKLQLPSSQFLTAIAEKNSQYFFLAVFEAGGLFVFRKTAFTSEAKMVLKRFADVFNLAYKRFIELENAEALAREAQIEVALERVRSCSLSMRKSNELKEVVRFVFSNLNFLGIQNMDAININIIHEGATEFDLWAATSGHEYTRNFRLPYFDHPVINDFLATVKNGATLHQKVYPFEVKNEFFRHMFTLYDNQFLPEERKALMLGGKAYAITAAIAEYSCIFIYNYSGKLLSDEDVKILIRFSKVFDQAYKRYLDLHKAELLVREALRQASLDRIRGQVASMRTSADLQNIIPLIWKELGNMEITFIRCGIFIMDETKSVMEGYLSTPHGESLGALQFPFDDNELIVKTIDHWRRKEILRQHWTKEEFLLWVQYMNSKAKNQNSATLLNGIIPPASLELHLIPFCQGMIYVGSVQPLSVYELDLVRSLAESFSIAYARYEDFTRLDKAKQNVEAALVGLKAAQAQLIQSEKMASLGELTAGIAHEIQNPLNFVKNFSEVNKELAVELKEELDNGNIEAAKAITKDIIENEDKINIHGQRAEAIVKGMLQHSRGALGAKEPTNINTLCDQYIHLAFHGLRAKDKTFNATIKTDFDKNLAPGKAGSGKINIIPQDIGRVLLNLLNNAFYAVNEKKNRLANAAEENKKEQETNYEPTVTIATKKKKNSVQVMVTDNGNGIPPKVLDKIFQPFFTTKPTGQGTGLGLSLSYDIVKAHGGDITVETKDGDGTTFTICLPT